MAQHHLVLTVRLHDARYHGTGDWPPAPARVFQALVAGAAHGRTLPADAQVGLRWLERLGAPVIAAPHQRAGQRIGMFVPNNDADAVEGDPARISEIRTKKAAQARLIEGDDPLLYAWPIEAPDRATELVEQAAERLYQLGRGVDMAWATAEVVDAPTLAERLARHRGTVHRPAVGAGARSLTCPTVGSLESLLRRHAASAQRLRDAAADDGVRKLFVQPPKPLFAQVAYDAAGTRHVYELKATDGSLYTWPTSRTVDLVARLRDGAADRLRMALPAAGDMIERALVGRKADGRDAAPTGSRIHIVPLPSIGHIHADRGIRRICVEIPSGCPLDAADVHWAFSGLEAINPETGEIAPFALVPGNDDRMLDHYVGPRRIWRTVTPAALPQRAARRRIEPSKQVEAAKPARERAAEEAEAVNAVRDALRHAGVTSPITAIRVQREPFEAKGTRAERFAPNTRFVKERLWHVEIRLADAVDGPLTIGDGRFLGLGVMAPHDGSAAGHALLLEGGLEAGARAEEVARALRRAVMARAQAELEWGVHLPAFFSGHSADGAPAARETDPHLAFHADLPARALVLAPHVVDRRHAHRAERDHLALLDRAVSGMSELRAGHAGRLTVRAAPLDIERDPLFAVATEWASITPYSVTRHRQAGTGVDAIIADVLAECARLRLPRPTVEVGAPRGVAGAGLAAAVVLRFPVAVAGPIVLGRTRYLGGGLFGPRRRE